MAATPFFPTLRHFAAVAIAVPLINKFDIKILDKIFAEKQPGNSTASEESTRKNLEDDRAKESLELFIPAHLRQTVLEAVHVLLYAVEEWEWDHLCRFERKDICLKFRSDGSIDTVKTAQDLVWNEKISIRKRFKIACWYCMALDVEILWSDMEESGQTNVSPNDDCMVNFWVKFFSEGRPVLYWAQYIPKYLEPFDLGMTFGRKPRFSAFFPFLKPKDRKEYFEFVRVFKYEDLRLCRSIVTEKEKNQILKTGTLGLLARLQWPQQSLFLETAEKEMKYIDKDDFEFLVGYFLQNKVESRWKYFDYSELFESFWNMSNNELRKSLTESSFWRREVDSCLNKNRTKKLRMMNERNKS